MKTSHLFRFFKATRKKFHTTLARDEQLSFYEYASTTPLIVYCMVPLRNEQLSSSLVREPQALKRTIVLWYIVENTKKTSITSDQPTSCIWQ